MAKGKRSTQRSAERRRPSAPRVPAQNHEMIDGILVQIKETELTIGRETGRPRKVPGYEIRVAIPEWRMNRGLLKSVR